MAQESDFVKNNENMIFIYSKILNPVIYYTL
jgi:hypothetical protein